MNFVNITVSQAQSLFAGTSVDYQPTASNAAPPCRIWGYPCAAHHWQHRGLPRILVLCRQDRGWPLWQAACCTAKEEKIHGPL